MFFGLPPKDDTVTRFGVFPKGRRLGATHGASVAFIAWMLEGKACLWGDTVNANIDRYVARYFIPFLNQYKIPYQWSTQKKLLVVGTGYTDFRSADRPENWEGFGYARVFLNEAGIILQDTYLYNNAVLPMLLDYRGSMLIAAGTPKLSRGKGRLFRELWKEVEGGSEGYFGAQFSTYDNPFLDRAQVDNLKSRIPAFERDQEIYGQFVSKGGSIIQREWFGEYLSPPQVPSRVVQSWDTASKNNQLNDPSVCTTWFEFEGYSYLIDVDRQWLKYPDLKRNVIEQANRFNPDVVLIEDASSGIALIQDLQADPMFNKPIVPVKAVKDKITRLATGSLYIENGSVLLPPHAPWKEAYLKELCEFPDVKNDDQADSTSQYINWASSKPYLWQ